MREEFESMSTCKSKSDAERDTRDFSVRAGRAP
jgi:hypothetical protein